jgi:hypothetical protein
MVPATNETVVYVPESQILYFENGRIREAAEEMARGIVVYYDKENENEAVAIRIDRAEIVLKPFVDAVLVRNGITPDPNAPRQLHEKGYRETVTTQIRHEEWELAPYCEATYDPYLQRLLIENGDSSNTCRAMGKDVHVLYGRDDDDAPDSAVAIRIDHAEIVLKPFVDAILAKYGIEHSDEPQEIDINAADD